MSREVDTRVVEMQFNNADFEKNTKTSIKSIDRLMEKLKFKGAEKGFEKLDAAAEKVDFDGMARSLDKIENKFSAFSVVATTALVNITNKVVDAGEKLVKSLSVDQIASGWDKYVEKTGNVQTIMNATGKSIDQVNGYLNKLMWYSDETSFSFAEMTSALSQMTAAGGNIDKMIPMIMGIANATADAGKSGLAFQSTIRNITQSYSAGFLQLQDWKSLNLMGTATKALKQELIDTATELGVLDKNGYDSAKHLVNLSTFETTLSDKWANTTVMEKTFEKYSSMMQEAYEMVQKDPSLSTSEALEQLSGKYGEIAERSALAAQQAKSFKEVLDATSDAVSSKWMKAFETIFGNYEEATATWTEMANRLYDVFAEPLNDLNRELSAGLDNGWQQFQSKLGDSSDFYVQMLERVMVANGSITQEAINEAGGFAAALREGGVSAEQLQNGLNESYSQLSALAALSDDALKAKGLDPDQVKKLAEGFAELNDEVSKGELDLSKYSEKIGEISGREHLMQSIWNIFDAIGKIVEPVQKAWAKFFEGIDSEKIYSFAEAVDRVTAKLSISDETADKIERTFSGIFAVLNVGRNALLAVGKILGQVFNAVSPLAGGFLSVTAALGDCLVEMADAINNSTVFKSVLDGIYWIIGKVSEGMQALAGVLTTVSNNVSVVFDPLKTLGKWFTSFINFIAPGLYAFGSAADEVFKEFGASAKEAFNSLDTEKLANVVNSGLIAGILAGIKGFLKSAKELTSSAGDIIGTIKSTIGSLGEAIDTWKQSKKTETLMTIAKSVAIMAASLTVLSMIKPERLTGSIGALTAAIGELVGAFLLLDKFGGNTKSTKLTAMSVAMVAMASSTLILAGAAAKLASIDSGKLVSSIVALGSIMGGLTAVSVVLSKTGGKFMKGATGMIAFATAIRILANAVNAMSSLSWDQMKVGLGGIGILCVELAAFLAASKFDKLGVLKGTGLILLATALNILQSAVAKFGSMNLDEIQNGLTAVGIALAEFAAFGFVAGFSKKMLATSSSVLILSGSMIVLGKAMSSISSLDGESIKKSLIAIGGALAEFVLALNFTKGTLGSAASLTAMTVAINLLVPALTGLGNLSLAQIGTGLLAIAGAFGVVGIAATLLTPVAPVIVSLSLAISALAISIGAMVSLVTAADFFARLGNSLSALNGLSFQVFLANIKAMAWLLVEFVAGIFQGLATIAGSIASSIATIVSAVCDGIAQAAPSIGNALAQLIVTVCNVIVQCSEPIGQALFTLGTVAIQTIIDLIGWAWDGGGGEGGGIKGALSELLENAAMWFSEHFNPMKLLSGLQDKISGFFGGIGEYMSQGLANGLTGSASSQIIDSGVQTLCNRVKEFFRNAFGIHSPSIWMEQLGQWFAPGLTNGLNGATSVAELNAGTSVFGENVKNGLSDTFDGLKSWMYNKGSDAASSFYNGLGAANVRNGSKDDWFDDWYKKEIDKYRNVSVSETVADNAAEEILKALFGSGDTNTNTNPTTTTKSSTTKKKTVAETIAEEYTKKLKANKYLQDALTKETTLWNLQNEDAVSNEELLAKRSETVAKAIELQTNRVQIAQEQYNELLKKAPKDDKTKDAYNTLLDEKASLEKLKQSRRDDIWEDVLSRYENDTKTAEDEYNLWASTYEKTASVTEKSNKKIEAINRKIGIQAEVVTAAEKDYTELKAEFGEQSQRTQEAYRKYLEEQKEQQDLINELEEAQLEQFDNQISRYEKEYALIQNKQNMLAKIYDDGSLADQKSAYESAVNQYGEDSKEARAASRQGVMSALIATGTAVSNLADSYKKLAVYQGKYDAIADKTSDDALDAYAALQQEQYNFVGFAENLADAMDMGDSGKKAMMQLGYTISKNWQPIQNGFQKVWAKLPENMTTGLTQAMNLAMTEGAAETTSSLMQTIVAAMSGNYATAMVAGLNTVLNFMNTEFGKQVLDGVSTVLGKAAAALGADSGTGLGLFTKLAGAAGTTATALGGTAEVAGESVGVLAKLSGVLGTVGTKVTGLLQTAGLGLSKALGAVGASVSTILPEVGTALASVAGMLGPQGLIALAIGAVGAGTIGLMANWDKVKTWFANFGDWLREKFTGLWNGIKSFGQGVISGFKSLFGIHSPSTVMAEIGGNIMQGLENGIADSAEGVNRTLEEAGAGALEIATQSAEQLLQTLNNEDSYEPVIRPVVDLTDAREGTAWMRDNLNDTAYTAGINLTRTTELAGAVARNADRQKDADREREEPAADEMSNRDIVTAIGSLGDRIDGVADAVANMRLSIDKKKFVGEIIDDVDERLGKISKQRRR